MLMRVMGRPGAEIARYREWYQTFVVEGTKEAVFVGVVTREVGLSGGRDCEVVCSLSA
jgi:hypothetical protein